MRHAHRLVVFSMFLDVYACRPGLLGREDDRLVGSSHTSMVRDSTGVFFFGTTPKDVRTRIVLGISCRYWIPLSRSSMEDCPFFPSFSSIPCRGTVDHSEPQVPFLPRMRWCGIVSVCVWEGMEHRHGDSHWGGEIDSCTFILGGVASRTTHLRSHTHRRAVQVCEQVTWEIKASVPTFGSVPFKEEGNAAEEVQLRQE